MNQTTLAREIAKLSGVSIKSATWFVRCMGEVLLTLTEKQRIDLVQSMARKASKTR